jgi:hypothetical protein
MSRLLVKGFWTATAALLIWCAAAGPATAAARKKRMSEHRLAVYGMIRRVQSQAAVFEKVLKPSLKKSAFRGTSKESDLIADADNITVGTGQIRNEFKNGRSTQSLKPEVSDLFVAAERINIVMSNVKLAQPAATRWLQLRDALNNLGGVYRLKPLVRTSPVGGPSS